MNEFKARKCLSTKRKQKIPAKMVPLKKKWYNKAKCFLGDAATECKQCFYFPLTLTLLNLTKSYKNYLQNMQHVVLRNRPTLSIGTERLACLNSPHGVQLWTLAWYAAGPGPGRHVARAFFSALPFFLLREIVFFAPSPPNPRAG